MTTAPYVTAATSKGQVDGSLSSQWMSRPDDQRFLNLTDLRDQVRTWAEQSSETVVQSDQIKVLGDPQQATKLMLAMPGIAEPMAMTNWSFGQIASQAGAPAGYLRKLPGALAAINLAHGLKSLAPIELKAYHRTAGGGVYLRAATSPSYGRIYDHDVVDLVMKVIGDDPRWKVPGTIQWGKFAGAGKVYYDPNTPVTKEGTTLYASDRDVFGFLCDDLNPIEVGKLDDGTPDLMFRGFIFSNSETGNELFQLRMFMLRGVCQNRNLWGVEDVSRIVIRHNAKAPERFIADAGGALKSYTDASAAGVVAKVKAAKGITFKGDHSERKAEQVKLLHDRLKFSQKDAEAIVGTDPDGQGKAIDAPRHLWGLFNAGTAWARKIPHQDDRVAKESVLAKMLAKV